MQIISNAGEKAGPRGIVRRSAYTTKLSNVDPKAWLADVLARIADHPSRRLAELLPWNRTPATERDVAKAA